MGALAAGAYLVGRYALPYLQNWMWPGGPPMRRLQVLEQKQQSTKATVENVETICSEVRYRTTSLESSLRHLAKDVHMLSSKVDRLVGNLHWILRWDTMDLWIPYCFCLVTAL